LSHLFEPLISTPKKGIRKRKRKEIKKKGNKNFSIFFSLWNEITSSKIIATIAKIKCLIKRKYVSLFNFSPTNCDVEEKEKNKPSKKRKIMENKICLSIFLHHLANPVVSSRVKLNIIKYFGLSFY
jgi:hypothetical protein